MAYAKHTWQTGETITATKLNNIENGIATNDEAVSAVAESVTEVEGALDEKANVDGVYETMTVGNAEQLVSTQVVEDSEPYIFRTSGGSADIGNREEDTIVGGSIAWNQLVENGNFADGTTGWNGSSATLTVADGVATVAFTGSAWNNDCRQTKLLPLNHKYLYLAMVKASNGFVGQRVTIGSLNNSKYFDLTANWQTIYHIASLASDSNFVRISNGADASTYSGESYSVKNFMVFDLTQMFGTTVADAVYAMEQANAGSGVAWFKAQYPLDYYAYNTGELKSVEGLVSHDMVGFNQWDEQWESGSIDGTTGGNNTISGYLRSKNYAHVVPSTIYYFKTSTPLYLYGYDANKNYVSMSSAGYRYIASSGLTEIPSNVHYIRISWAGTTYANDICINLSWSGTRNGEYEPYQKRSYALDSTLTLRGIPKVDANGKMYYDGDTYEADGTVTRKYGIVDLGTLNWTYYETGTNPVFRVGIPNRAYGSVSSGIAGMCNKYTFYKNATLADMTENMADKYIGFQSTNTYVVIRDTAYTDATAFKTAMSGVYLVYELATPTTEQADPFTTPQIVDDFGTEEYVTTGIVAVGHTTKYGSNLRDKLQHLPNLAENDGAYLIQQTGTQMTLVNFRIPKAENLADGTYVLKATVSGGTPTYTWEAEQ